ncbi:RGCVC family protein [Lentzea kentuckyensis]|uniref:RGCVC family protein n=1 Tax=Lentzea kentuckyensis TaxID=360086 RepID=UPI0013027E88|nr:RGCVC family protein [Lentzea kentuckyensis]
MPTSELRIAVPAGHSDAAAICAVCPHPSHEHDPIGVRYCTATMAAALPRGCICR